MEALTFKLIAPLINLCGVFSLSQYLLQFDSGVNRIIKHFHTVDSGDFRGSPSTPLKLSPNIRHYHFRRLHSPNAF